MPEKEFPHAFEMAPAYGAVTTAITSVEGGLQFMNGAYQ